MTYTEVIEELKNAGIAAKEGAYFDYELSPNVQLYRAFREACQNFLESDDLKEFFEFPRMYFCTNTTFNAGAYIEGKYSLVEIFAGAIQYLYTLYREKRDVFDNEKITHYTSIAAAFQITADEYLFQITTSFLMYHETGHLIQRNNQSASLFEYNENGCNDKVEERHVKEFDADWFASNRLVMQILGLVTELHGKLDTVDKVEFLHKMAELALAALYISFVDLAEGEPKIYYDRHCHPHPAVRLTYIVIHFVDTVQFQVGVKIDQPRIIRNTLMISTDFMKEKNPNPVEAWSKEIYEKSGDIQVYINKLVEDCNKYPECCRNKLRTNKVDKK